MSLFLNLGSKHFTNQLKADKQMYLTSMGFFCKQNAEIYLSLLKYLVHSLL